MFNPYPFTLRSPIASISMSLSEDIDTELKQALLKYPNLNVNTFMGKREGHESFWVSLQPFLLSRGYRLRPRYHPNWIPSWKGEKHFKGLHNYEDAMSLITSNLIDAVRVGNGQRVVIKCVKTLTEEIAIVRYLTSGHLPADPRNRTVPILDIIALPNDETQALIVMPQLLEFFKLPFRRVGEVAEAFKQYIQGLEFMHEHNIVHRDACLYNLMMDVSQLIPRGLHFNNWMSHDGVNHRIEWRERAAVKSLQYYFIDFDVSHRYPPGLENIKDTGIYGQDRSVPERSLDVPYDPFKVDVYQLGNVLLNIIQRYEGLEPLQDLGSAMTRKNADDRPSPSQALELLGKLDRHILCRRVWRRGTTSFDRFMITFCRAKYI
ncbi:hypothetical protein Hypma_002167 [Hypsizygus marmoreus]|uniref:Protein kinase domain-containing protein n=1 Tax=Hypsizygus marmoreus TaxID=39966 RepID=A0A369K384_HYPMA|nr:hypothetical protein Hypma_002167 [Hypsizygus marmoreus]